MKTAMLGCGMIVLLLALALTPGCGGGGDGGSDQPAPGPPANTPDIPVPAHANDVLPDRSAELQIGLSGPLEKFEPRVAAIEMMQDSGTPQWYPAGRNMTLACADVLPEYSSDPALLRRAYIAARPRLLHKRYWRMVETQMTLTAGLSHSIERTVTSGRSITDEKSVEFSRTIGVALDAGEAWKAFSAAITASYEQTSTVTEVRSVAFTETKSETKTYTATPSRLAVWAVWQLVDKFSLVDENKVPIDESLSLLHVHIDPVADIEFPANFVYQSLTEF